MRGAGDSDDIDQLIAELHASGGGSKTTPGDTGRIDRWLGILADAGGSDLLLVAGAPPSIRVSGRIRPLADGPLDGVDIEEAVLPALPPHARRLYRDAGIADGSYRIDGVGRFRINLHRERGRAAAALRAPLRQAPDVIVVGEMRDPETMRIALAAAETGHLVLSTVHTTDAASTVARIADSFPDERQNTIRQELS